jgi:hypothetical protein
MAGFDSRRRRDDAARSRGRAATGGSTEPRLPGARTVIGPATPPGPSGRPPKRRPLRRGARRTLPVAAYVIDVRLRQEQT